ncbi:hypothetical protein MBEHAL_0796 [Halarchaeum acidiphilum MH1-52-1]|uniref:Uncharacterized protein n=1 Tax=Halarchaeum acidiphilum MH1-52-1 TaxID=1261545 RepID=U2YE71_9EURY|nr:hypothetical protein MBEHAL_0796 [Halarchaeum acidiphilum MH1-52-1]
MFEDVIWLSGCFASGPKCVLVATAIRVSRHTICSLASTDISGPVVV